MADPVGRAAPVIRRMRPAEAAPVLALLRAAFAGMEGRIDPPSSLHRLTEAGIAEADRAGEIWVAVAEDAPVACLFLTPQEDALYLGKLAVAETARGLGLARRLVAQAEERARAMGLGALELQVRVELRENHAAFAQMGFVQTRATAHPGYSRPTSLTFRRPVAEPH